MAAFTDTVEELPIYQTGICGEKRLTLDAGSPAFMKVDTASSQTTLKFNHLLALGADIKTHLVSYTVNMVEYSGIVNSIHGSF